MSPCTRPVSCDEVARWRHLAARPSGSLHQHGHLAIVAEINQARLVRLHPLLSAPTQQPQSLASSLVVFP